MTSENIGWDPLRVELLWDLKEPPRRGPKPTLTVTQIATTAMEIADHEGLAAVSMQRVADELAVGTMSLYTYIPDKDALLEVMLDLAFGDTLSRKRSTSWRRHLEEGAAAILSAYQQHPWALQIFIGGPPLGPRQLRFLEAALQALAETGLDDSEKIAVVMSVTSFVRGSAHLSVGITESQTRSELTEEQVRIEYTKAYNRVLDPEQFPITSRLLAGDPDEDQAEPENYDFGFEYGLSRLLEGIERRVESRPNTSG